jgi:hypothetical protein
MTHCLVRCVGLVVLLTLSSTAQAYPEFQRHLQAASGRVVSCSMCHVHPDGPDGVKHGQLGSLGDGELQALNRSRAMLDPGARVDNPILNDFGDYLVSSQGRRRLIAVRATPARLVDSIDRNHDQDSDGIADARELRDGTDPTDPRHGDPWLLFLINVRRYWFHLAMLSAATFAGLHSLNRLFRWFAYEAQRAVDAAGTHNRRPDPPKPS